MRPCAIIPDVIRLLAVFLLAVAAVRPEPAQALAEADIAGGWAVEWMLPWGGTAEYPMWVIQDGSRLTGRVTFPGVAEYPLKGTIEEDRFRIVWQNPIDGEWVEVVFAGTVKGDVFSGTAKIGKWPEGDLSGRRTER
jgi:hypothetical protein